MVGNEVAVAIISFVGVLVVAVLGVYVVLLQRRNGQSGNGAKQALKPVPVQPVAPVSVHLDDAQAQALMQQVYAKLLDETQEERDRLKDELEHERAARRDLAERVDTLANELAEYKMRELKLLEQIAALERRIESQARELRDYRETGRPTAEPPDPTEAH